MRSTLTSAFMLFILNLTFQPISPVSASPTALSSAFESDLLPRHSPPRPKHQGERCYNSSCNNTETIIDVTEVTVGPVWIYEDLPVLGNITYTNQGCDPKEYKRHRRSPPAHHKGKEVRCAGEFCIDHRIKGYNHVALLCTHMAGREWETEWWTCCPHRTFAAIDGNCCTELNTTTWECATGAEIPLNKYLVD